MYVLKWIVNISSPKNLSRQKYPFPVLQFSPAIHLNELNISYRISEYRVKEIVKCASY